MSIQGNDTQGAAGQPTGTEGQGSAPVPQPAPEYSEFAQGILKDVPEGQKALIAPFMKQWDAEVTKKIQGIHQEYAPYKDLGEVDSLQEAMRIAEILENDPQRVYEILHQEYGQQAPVGNQQIEQNSGGGGLPPELEPFLTPFQQQLQEQRDLVTKLAEHVLNDTRTRQQQTEDQQLDAALETAKKSLGDFDEDYVLAKMAKGIPIEKAVEAYKNMVQGFVNSQGQGTQPIGFPVLSGQGAAPVDATSITKLGSNDVKSLVAAALAQAAQSDRK